MRTITSVTSMAVILDVMKSAVVDTAVGYGPGAYSRPWCPCSQAPVAPSPSPKRHSLAWTIPY